MFSIFPDGTYTPCPFLLEVSEEFALGNILNDSLESIRSRLKEFKIKISKELEEISSSTEACLKCSFRSTCGLGCYILKVVRELNYNRPSLKCKNLLENQKALLSELSEQEESQIREFVKAELSRSDIAHRFDHVENVVALAKFIAVEEKANLRIVVPAAYFHDIAPRENIDSLYEHVDKSQKKAKEYLRKNLNFTSTELDNIVHAIVCSAWESHLKGIEPETLEAKVVRDADWLDAIGARGIARVFGFAGYCKLDMGDVEYDPEMPVKLDSAPEKIDPSPFHHFFSKLLWIKDGIQTDTGKVEAKRRHDFMINFLRAYKLETQYIK